MCEPTETAQSLDDDTRAVVARPNWHERTDCTQSVVLCVGGLRARPIDTCSNKDVGKRERETPTLSNVNKLTSKHQIHVHYTQHFKMTHYNTIRNETIEYETALVCSSFHAHGGPWGRRR